MDKGISMENSDLKFLKGKYGENFAKLCRKLFSTLLETEGSLKNIITTNFAESKFLYDDIVNNGIEEAFKNYVFSFSNKEKRKK